jgi:predicted anti-sigma-YlaC factor YlaD
MSIRCDRVRQWAGLAPDGVLSEIEQRLLDVHLEKCTSCREFHSSIERFTSELRAAPLEAPASPTHVAGRARRRWAATLRPLGAVAAAALVAVASPLLVRSIDGAHRTSVTSIRPVILDATSIERDQSVFLRQVRDYSQVRHVLARDRNARGHPGLIAS